MGVLTGLAAAFAASTLSFTQPTPLDQSASAPSNQTDVPTTTVDDVEVNARRALPDAVHAFVDEIAAPVTQRGMARWNGHRVCVGAANMRREAAQALIDRVSMVGDQIGIEPGEPGCRPDVLIVGAPDGADMAQAMVSARPRIFNFPASGSNAGLQALERFQEADVPVRWWAISLPTDSWTGQATVRVGAGAPPKIEIFAKSQMRGRIRDDLQRIIVIVDFAKAEGLTLDQLGDYVAMVAFAQIDPDADTSAYQTVLNLFDNPGEAGGLTEWDRAYLSTLYRYRNERILPFRQAELMTTALQTAPEAAAH